MIDAAIFLTIFGLGFNQGWYSISLETDVIRLTDFFCAYLLFEGLAARMKSPRSGRLLGLAILLLGWAFVGYWQSRFDGYFWRQWLDILRGVVTFAALVSVLVSERRLRVAIAGLAALAVVEAGLAMYEWKYGVLPVNFFGASDGQWGRVKGSFVHPNMLGTFFAVALPLLIARGISHQQRGRLVYIGAAVVTAAGLMLTFSRTGWAAAGLACLVVFAIAVSSRRLSTATAGLLLFGLLMAGGVLVVKYPEMFLRRFETAANEMDTAHPASRLSLALDAVEMVESAPIAGVGLGNYEATVYNSMALRTHTTYLYVAAEIGLVGLLLYLLILGKAFFWAYRDRRHPNDGIACIAIGLIGSHIAFGLASFTDLSPWADSSIMQLLWIVLALTAATHRLAKREEAPDPSGAWVPA